MRYDRAQDYKEQRLDAPGLFRCDRCDPMSATERRTIADTAANLVDDYVNGNLDERATDPPVSVFYNVSSVTSISPTTLNLARGGASGQIVLTGIYFTANDTVAASSGSITVTPSVDSSTQITLTISAAGGMTRGDYDLTFNGSTLTPRGILKVR
jgi:hypothetical protein